MASKRSDEAKEQQEKRSGTSTREYKNVRESMEPLIRAIKADDEAKETLFTKFQAVSWIDVTVRDISAKSLVTKALDMIERSPTEHETFLKMLNDTTGLQDILPNLKATQEESDPTQAKQDLVVSSVANSNSKQGQRHLQLKVKPEADSGYSGQYETPPCPKRIISDPLVTDEKVEQSSATASGNMDSLNYTNGAVNTESQQDTGSVEDQPGKPMFGIGPNEEGEEVNKTENDGPNEHTSIQEESSFVMNDDEEGVGEKPVQVESQFDEETAKIYLSPSLLEERKKREEEIKNLKQKLQAEIDEKNALKQEMEELKERLRKIQESEKEREDASNKTIQEKMKELEECKNDIARVEREKIKIESEYKKKIQKLEEDVAQLESNREMEKNENKAQVCDLQRQLSEANLKISEKDNEILMQKNEILKQEKEISGLQHTIVIKEKDAEIARLNELLNKASLNKQ